jgi:plasmid stabilization system protein ParE
VSGYLVTPAAERDIENLCVYIGLDSLEASERFRSRCHETFSWLAGMPRAGRAWPARSPRLRGVRIWAVAGFPNHLVFYRPRGRELVILHVMSGARDLPEALGD